MRFRNIFVHCFASHIIIVLSISALINYVHGARENPKAFGYEKPGKGGKSAEFNDDPYMWKNVKNVLKYNGMRSLGELCVTGMYLLYANISYQADNEKGIKLLSGNDACVAPGKVYSVLLAAPYKPTDDSSLTVFKDTIIRGTAFAVSKTTYDFDSKFGAKVNSLILKGKDSYTVVSSSGKKYCFQPKEKSKDSICMLLNLKNTSVEQDNQWYSVSRTCGTKAMANPIELTNCYKYGTGKLEDIIYSGDDEVNPNPDNKNETSIIVPETSPIQDCKDNEELLDLLGFRLSNNFMTKYQMRFPTDKSNIWRTDIVDTAFDIVIAACPEPLISAKFFAIVREFYIYLIEKTAWKDGKGWPENKTVEVERIMDMSDHCMKTIDGNRATIRQMSMIDYEAMEEPYLKEGDYREELRRIDGYDKIMEIVWLVYNYVASLCHHTLDFKDNWWADFSVLFNDMYLEPMKNYWKAPGKFQNAYQVILSGYNVSTMYEGLALCTTNIFFTMPTLELLQRPEGL